MASKEGETRIMCMNIYAGVLIYNSYIASYMTNPIVLFMCLCLTTTMAIYIPMHIH